MFNEEKKKHFLVFKLFHWENFERNFAFSLRLRSETETEWFARGWFRKLSSLITAECLSGDVLNYIFCRISVPAVFVSSPSVSVQEKSNSDGNSHLSVEVIPVGVALHNGIAFFNATSVSIFLVLPERNAFSEPLAFLSHTR